MEQPPKPRQPIINCHTHIFTSDHVPPWLAKKYLFWPAYLLLHTGFVVGVIKWWYKVPYREQFTDDSKRVQKIRLAINFFLYRLGMLYQLVGWFLTIQAFFILYDALKAIVSPNNGISIIEFIRQYLVNHKLLYIGISPFINVAIIAFILIFFKWGRNFIGFIFKKLWKFLGMLPGKQTFALFQRYLRLAQFSTLGKQSWVFGKLRDQYPQDTAFVILPMDMEFMAAGKIKANYKQQMEELAKIKEKNQQRFYPFVFADARRVAKEKESFFDYDIDANGKQILKDCFIKKFIEEKKFSGFKIYPALGYFPFDKELLPLWKYAADNQIPITTHCIKGTIFYRGTKKEEWNRHEIFEQTFDGGTEPLLLPQLENEKFSWNFTHPLNYLCLLKEELLRKIVSKTSDKTKLLFGYSNDETPLKYNLEKLKICLAHFGGDDEWRLFLDRDRDNFSAELIEKPNWGIELFVNKQNEPLKGKLEQVWRFTDWYSIICSLMLQFENVYSDISYIVHNNDIQPLLKETLRNKKLSERVLFGTDFYVVRNHKSERNMLVDCLSGLSEEEINLIARKNPRSFLFNELHGALLI